MSTHTKRNKALISHINRIQGQLESLKTNITENQTREIAMLSTSAIKSFDSLRGKIIENYVLTELMTDESITLDKLENFQTVLKLVRA